MPSIVGNALVHVPRECDRTLFPVVVRYDKRLIVFIRDECHGIYLDSSTQITGSFMGFHP